MEPAHGEAAVVVEREPRAGQHDVVEVGGVALGSERHTSLLARSSIWRRSLSKRRSRDSRLRPAI